MDPQVKVIAEVIQERKNQDRQWGGPAHDDAHAEYDWVCYIDRQAGLIHSERDSASSVRSRFIKIAALAVAAVESIDRRK